MSITPSSLLDLAFGLANVESGNITAARQMALLNEVLIRYYRDLGGVDGVHDLTAASTPALTAGQGEYPLPSGIAQVDEYRFVAWRKNSASPWIRLFQTDHTLAEDYSQEEGTPFAFYIYHPGGVETFGLVPAPDAAAAASGILRRRFRYKPVEVTDPAATIALPPEAHGPLAAMLAAEFCLLDNNPQMAMLLKAKAQEERAKNSETLLDQTLSELSLSGVRSLPGVGPRDRRFWGL